MSVLKIFKKKEKDLLIRVLEYAYPIGKFKMRDVRTKLKLTEEQIEYIRFYERSGGDNSTKQLFERREQLPENEQDGIVGVNYLRLTPQAIFHYLEYVELVHAKRNARWSTVLSIIAISLAAITTTLTLMDKWIIHS